MYLHVHCGSWTPGTLYAGASRQRVLCGLRLHFAAARLARSCGSRRLQEVPRTIGSACRIFSRGGVSGLFAHLAGVARRYRIARLGSVGQRRSKRVRTAVARIADRTLGMAAVAQHHDQHRSEEHTSELKSLMRNSYAVFFLKKKNKKKPSGGTPSQSYIKIPPHHRSCILFRTYYNADDSSYEFDYNLN